MKGWRRAQSKSFSGSDIRSVSAIITNAVSLAPALGIDGPDELDTIAAKRQARKLRKTYFG